MVWEPEKPFFALYLYKSTIIGHPLCRVSLIRRGSMHEVFIVSLCHLSTVNGELSLSFFNKLQLGQTARTDQGFLLKFDIVCAISAPSEVC